MSQQGFLLFVGEKNTPLYMINKSSGNGFWVCVVLIVVTWLLVFSSRSWSDAISPVVEPVETTFSLTLPQSLVLPKWVHHLPWESCSCNIIMRFPCWIGLCVINPPPFPERRAHWEPCRQQHRAYPPLSFKSLTNCRFPQSNFCFWTDFFLRFFLLQTAVYVRGKWQWDGFV